MKMKDTKQRGASLIEVMVALFVSLVGILGFVALQGKALQAELDVVQREQGARLLDFMVNQINTNRDGAACYGLTQSYISEGEAAVVAGGVPYVGTGFTGSYSCSSAGNLQTQNQISADIAKWNALLIGRAETLDGADVGAMIGARGCINYDSTNNVFTLAVAWQGMATTTEPSSSCAQGLYGEAGKRRVLSTTVHMADLEA